MEIATDVFLSKFDLDGNFQWCRTWGGLYSDLSTDLVIDGVGMTIECEGPPIAEENMISTFYVSQVYPSQTYKGEHMRSIHVRGQHVEWIVPMAGPWFPDPIPVGWSGRLYLVENDDGTYSEVWWNGAEQDQTSAPEALPDCGAAGAGGAGGAGGLGGSSAEGGTAGTDTGGSAGDGSPALLGIDGGVQSDGNECGPGDDPALDQPGRSPVGEGLRLGADSYGGLSSWANCFIRLSAAAWASGDRPVPRVKSRASMP